MAELNEPEVQEDPMSDHNLAIQQFIASARIYDALLTLITLQDGAVAKDLMELHMAGHLLGPAPSLSGTFLTNDMNTPDESGDMNGSEEPSTNEEPDDQVD